MAVRFEYPEQGELVERGPVGTPDAASNDDFRFLAVGLPPETSASSRRGV